MDTEAAIWVVITACVVFGIHRTIKRREKTMSMMPEGRWNEPVRERVCVACQRSGQATRMERHEGFELALCVDYTTCNRVTGLRSRIDNLRGRIDDARSTIETMKGRR